MTNQCSTSNESTDDSMINYARCRCFLHSNVYLKRFGLHVTFQTESIFVERYGKTLSEMGCMDVDSVIGEVKAELERRRKIHIDSNERANYIKANYKPLHPDIFELQETNLHPDMLKLMDFLKEGLIDKAATLFKAVGDGVYSFPIFSSEFCTKIISEISHFDKVPMPKGRPNSMNKYGVLLDELGFNERLLTPLRRKYLEPLSQFLFPQESKTGFDSHKVFTVDYEEDKDVELDFHFDNSEITVNVCLLADCEGGELYFSSSPNSGFGYTHQQGRAVMHRGSDLHCVLPLVTGRRINLVMWMRSSAVRNLLCPMCSKTPDLEPVEYGWGDGFVITT